jgi:heterodisulfide reductase subunit B
MTALAYYPGCSLRHSAEEFDSTTRTLLKALDIDVQEVPDWTCCGASPAHMTDHLLAQALSTRNLRQAALISDEFMAPCPACYQREKSAEIEVHADDEFRAEVNAVMDKPYTGNVRVYNLPELLLEKVGPEVIAGLVKVDLSQLKVVPYYGCLLGRPSELTGECDNEQPMRMDVLLEAVGADVRWWNFKTECCGASVGVPKKIIQQRLTAKILEQAVHAGADAIVTACPLCHQNLDMRQAQTNSALGTDYNMPVLYLTQVMGLAMGFTADEMMLEKHAIDPRPLVEKAIAEAAELRAEEARKAADKAAKAKAKADKEAAEAGTPAAAPAAAPADTASSAPAAAEAPEAAEAPGPTSDTGGTDPAANDTEAAS